MSLKLDKRVEVAEGVRRIVKDRIDQALGLLRSKRGTPLDEVVHSARKRFKEVRAALRLLRGELGDEVFDQENRTFRDAGRPLSELRDAAALLQALDKLVAGSHGQLTAAAVRPLRASLLARRSEVSRRFELDKALETVAAAVETARRRVKEWPLRHRGWKAIGPALRRAYRDGRDARDRACRGGSDEQLHEWRKRVKDLRYQLEMLELLRPGGLGKLAGQAHALADRLGDDHDLSVLRELARSLARPLKQAEALTGSIEEKQDELRREARRLGRRLFAEKPGVFGLRIHADWDAFRSQ